jgi:WD40 repeat protein
MKRRAWQCAISASPGITLKVWNLHSGQVLRTLEGHMDFVAGVAVTPDGQRAISASWDKTLKVWDLHSGKCLTTFDADEALLACAVAPDGVTIVAGGESGRLHFLRFVAG